MSESRLWRVTALLIRAPELPAGDTRCGIELDLCLTPRGEPDPAAGDTEAAWRVRRFWRDRPDWHGFLVPLDNGWGLRGHSDPDEPLRVIEGRSFRPGEYLTLRRPNGEELLFRIVSVLAREPSQAMTRS